MTEPAWEERETEDALKWADGNVHKNGADVILARALRKARKELAATQKALTKVLTENRENFERVRALEQALDGVTRVLEAFSYTTQLGKGQMERLEAAREALKGKDGGS